MNTLLLLLLPYSIYFGDTYYPTYFFDSITVCPTAGSPSLNINGGKGIVIFQGTDFFKQREPRSVYIEVRYSDKIFETGLAPTDPHDPGTAITFVEDQHAVFGASFDDCTRTEI
jgi:hypothetical protein